MSEPKLIIGVLASGRGSNLESIFNAISAGLLMVKVGVVLSDKKDAKALERARNYQVPAIYIDPRAYPDKPAYDTAVVQALQAHQVDLVILAGYMRIVTQPFLEAFRNKIMNLHPSLLPSFPGLHAQRQALDHGVKVSGCTVHFVDAEVDHGPIIMQASVPVLEGDTEESLVDRILIEEHRILPRVIQYYVDGKLTVEGQRVMIDRGI